MANGEATQLLAVGADPADDHQQAGSTGFNQMPGSQIGALPAMSGMPTSTVHVTRYRVIPAWQVALFGLVLAMGAFLGYSYIDTGNLSQAMTMIGLSEVEPEALDPALMRSKFQPPQKSVPAAPQPPQNLDPAHQGRTAEAPSGPPTIWTSMKNEDGLPMPELAPNLNADQVAKFNLALNDEYPYQRYKAIVDLAALRARGSEDMLRHGLGSEKFWIRMRALIGLADIGEDISDDDVKMALGESGSELRARFFQRFEKSSCGYGCYYTARACLPHLDALGRLAVMRVISHEKSPVRDFYMVAATLDESESVKKFAHEWIDDHNVDSAVWEKLKMYSH